jgi:hypothetical protein
MTVDKAKTIHDYVLMTAFCIIWMASALYALGYFMDATTAPVDEAHFYFVRMFIACGIGLVGIGAHTHLLVKHKQSKIGDDDLWT